MKIHSRVFILMWMAGLAMAGSALNSAPPPQLLPPPLDQLPGWLAQRDVVQGPLGVTLGAGVQAQTVVFRHTQWQMKDLPQSVALSQRMEADAMRLAEPERLKVMNRFDDHVQIWVVSLNQHSATDASLKASLVPAALTNRYHRELAFLGRGQGQAWFAFMPIHEWIHLRKQLQLEGGDDPLAAAARGLTIKDPGSMTANSTAGILVEAGDAALPHLRALVDAPDASRVLGVLAGIRTPAGSRLLVDLSRSANPTTAAAARRALIVSRRPEAESLYFQWLTQDAGRTPVDDLLEACANVNRPRLAPLLPKILASPRNPRELRRAFDLSRELEQRPIPSELLEAEKTILRHGYKSGSEFDQTKVDQAAEVLVASPDVEAAIQIAVSLTCATTKGDWSPANQAGISVLKRLPGGRGQKAARSLSECFQAEWHQRMLQPAL